MAESVKHDFESAKEDGGDATLVRPSNWNAAHKGAQEIEDRDLTQVAVANTDAETTIYSHLIPAGILGTTGGIRLTIQGTMKKDAAGQFVIRAKLGATTAIASVNLDLTSGVQQYPFTLAIWFLNSAADAQKWGIQAMASWGVANLPLQPGNNVMAWYGAGYGTSAEDTANALLLSVTWDWTVADVNLWANKEMALLELIPPA